MFEDSSPAYSLPADDHLLRVNLSVSACKKGNASRGMIILVGTKICETSSSLFAVFPSAQAQARCELANRLVLGSMDVDPLVCQPESNCADSMEEIDELMVDMPTDEHLDEVLEVDATADLKDTSELSFCLYLVELFVL